MEANPQPAQQQQQQHFVVSHLKEADFKTGGLRDYSSYRDLGVAEATNGLAQAHVIRMIAPYRPELSVRHHHNVQPDDCELLEILVPAEHETVNDA